MCKHTPPLWFWLISGICLIWNIIGLIVFGMHIHVTEAELTAMSEAELGIYNSTPICVTLAFGAAAFIAFMASISLLLRRAMALLLFRISLLATTLQIFYGLFISDAYILLGKQGIVLASIVLLASISLCLFARYSKKRSWIR
ncbi:hypothetical protein [Paraferrimonas sp. SM1919]|uniref:hypothetical protein n=1 Tax=Paraferrimonas sp. SM1919 TaxID=2662263 RepID=UPI0013D67301|nr:hypothetical protein [Paraferrimonas sp. SM1919]